MVDLYALQEMMLIVVGMVEHSHTALHGIIILQQEIAQKCIHKYKSSLIHTIVFYIIYFKYFLEKTLLKNKKLITERHGFIFHFKHT